MSQNRCVDRQEAPATERPNIQRLTHARSLAALLVKPQVRCVHPKNQRLKRLKLPIYDAHTRSRTHANVSIYLDPESLQSLIFFIDASDLRIFPCAWGATQPPFSR